MPSATTPAPLVKVRSTNRAVVRVLGDASFALGFASIALSIIIWLRPSSPDAADRERFAIFIGLWAPTFFVLSSRLGRYGKARLAKAPEPRVSPGDGRRPGGP